MTNDAVVQPASIPEPDSKVNMDTETKSTSEKAELVLPGMSTVDTDMTRVVKEKIKDCIEEPELDSGLPHTLKMMSNFTISLPYEWKQFSEELRRRLEGILLDQDMKDDLESSHAMNWCRSTKPLYPIRIAGDGNCLLHAVSKAMWGIHDNTLLRRLVYIALVEDDQEFLHTRWQRERQQLDSKVPDGGVEFTEEEWDNEWGLVVKAAEDIKKKTAGDELPFECLEEIHIFVLSNVLKRPIIVLADTVIRNLEGSVLDLNNFPGIYLPLLWACDDCIKTPLVLGYSMNHFTPLIGFEHPENEDTLTLQPGHAVPLVNHMFEPLFTHFLTEEEESEATNLLQTYMNITEAPFTNADATNLVLAAAINYTPLPDEMNIVKKFFMICNSRYSEFEAKQAKKEQTKVSCSTRGCKRFGKPELDFFCPKCYLLRETESDNSNDADEIKSPSSPTSLTPSAPPVSNVSVDNQIENLAAARGNSPTTAAASVTQSLETPVVSVMEEKCSFPDCDNQCAQTTKPYCHEHEFLITVRQRKPDECLYPGCHDQMTASCKPYCQTHRLPTNEDEDSNGMEPSITESRCIEDGCHNFTSRFTHPHCHEHKLTSNISTTFCARIGCANYQGENSKPFCVEHAGSGDSAYTSSRVAPPADAEAGSDDEASSSRTRYEEMLPVFMAFICAVPSCDKKVSIDTDMYCMEHYIEKYGEAPRRSPPPAHAESTTIAPRRLHRSISSSGSPSPPTQTTETSVTQSRVESQHYSLDSLTVGGRKIRCHEPGCKLSGFPSWNFYCSQHRILNEDHSRPRVSMDEDGSTSPPPCAASPEPEARTNTEYRSHYNRQDNTTETYRSDRTSRRDSVSPNRFTVRRRDRSPPSSSDSPSPPRRTYSSGLRYDSYGSSRNEYSFPELSLSSASRETRTSNLYTSRYTSRDYSSSSHLDTGTSSRFLRSTYTRRQSLSPIRSSSTTTNHTGADGNTDPPKEDTEMQETKKPPQMIKMTPPEKPKSRLDKTRELLRIGLCNKTGCDNQAQPNYCGFCKGCAEQSQFIHIEKTVESVVIEQKVACKTSGCRLIGIQDLDGICYQCSNNSTQPHTQASINGHSDLNTMEILNDLPNENTTRTRNFKECKSENCSAVGSADSQGYCVECYTRLYRKGVFKQTTTNGQQAGLHNELNGAHGGARPKERRKVRSQSLDRAGAATDAMPNGNGESNGGNPLPSNPSLTSYETNMKTIKRCPGYGCNRVAYEAFNGMCQLCYNKSSQKAARIGSRVTPNKPSQPAQNKTTGNECKTEGCDMYGTESQMGYCSTCFKKSKSEKPGLAKRKYRRASDGGVTTAHVSVTNRCINNTCDMYGDPNLNGMCSQCYRPTNISTVTRPSNRQRHTNRVRNKPRRACPKPPPDRPAAASPTGNHALYEESLKKIEAASRSSHSRCKNTGCPNMGNSRCRGYCNRCFPFIQCT